MLDIGWQEFTLVAFILLIVVGPKDLPKVLKSIFGFINKHQFHGEFDHYEEIIRWNKILNDN